MYKHWNKWIKTMIHSNDLLHPSRSNSSRSPWTGSTVVSSSPGDSPDCRFVSTSHRQEWVPNKRHDFKWISEWTLNVWSEVSDGAVRSPAEERVKAELDVNRPPQEPLCDLRREWSLDGPSMCSLCRRQRSSFHGLTFRRNEKELRFMSVIYRKFHLWAITEHPIWTTSETLKGGTVVLEEPYSSYSGQTWTKSHLNITCHWRAPLLYDYTVENSFKCFQPKSLPLFKFNEPGPDSADTQHYCISVLWI